MRKLLFLVVLFVSATVNAQEILDTIAQAGCRCIQNKIDANQVDAEDFNMQFGLCIIDVASNYKAELKSKYDIDMTNLDSVEGEKLGKLVGVKMVGYCPNVFGMFSKKERGQEEEVNETLEMDGKIDAITKNQFYTVTVLDETNKRNSFLWLYDFENSAELLKDSKELKGKNVKILYINQDLFDANAQEARAYKIIVGVEFL